MLSAPLNPNGRPNSDVVRRRLTARDIVQTNQQGWLINFRDMPECEAALYELPFEYVRREVKPVRDTSRDPLLKRKWWLLKRTCPGLRRALLGATRCIVTPEVAKHRVFVWMSADVVPDHTCHVIAREDDYFFGVLQSALHDSWSLQAGSTLEDRPRYTATATFETFPFPWPPGKEPEGSPLVDTISNAARKLVEKRDAWLNPPGASGEELQARTLTNLYNARPAWLADAHRKLDEAVFAAYGWSATLTDAEILERLLVLNHERAAPKEAVDVPDGVGDAETRPKASDAP
jgi:hypothetical protein